MNGDTGINKRLCTEGHLCIMEALASKFPSSSQQCCDVEMLTLFQGEEMEAVCHQTNPGLRLCSGADRWLIKSSICGFLDEAFLSNLELKKEEKTVVVDEF